ncbi:MAG: cadmium-translocating P-type ATPase [Ruminococcus sp.]|nr:cadmium-translocating P-type ATPase [Ruminococcus sp.]
MKRKQKKVLIRIILSAAMLVPLKIFAPEEEWFAALLFAVPYLVIGYDVIFKAVRNIAHGQVFDENFLMFIATVGAFATGEYTEAAAVMLFYQIGELFQSVAVGRSRKSISELMDIRPDHANIEREGIIVEADPEEIAVGDTIIIKPGERIPLDGVVLEGESSVDTSALTGESLPKTVRPGDDVFSGCIDQTGLLRVRVTKPYGESTVARILDLVENAASKKAASENFITRFARVYTPAVCFAALALAVIPPIFAGGWMTWLHRALIFLVISCPCALVISVPLSFFGGIGGASRRGILVKGSSYLETLARTDTVVMDKTGTLTKGVFNVTAVHPERISEGELLELAAYAESYSSHPIAGSILDACNTEPDRRRITSNEEISGMGVHAVIDGREVFAGNDKLMDSIGVKWHPCHHVGTTVHIAVDGEYAGHLVISDELKETSAQAVRDLKAAGVSRTVMLTGDTKAVGEDTAGKLGIDEVYTELLPAGKVEKVEELIRTKPEDKALVFVGDGINDAPVLSRADVGIAMGAMGSDAAIEAADIVLMNDDPAKLAEAISLSRRTLRIVYENIAFALGVKGLVLVLGALGFASMWAAVFADVGVAVIAILNAMRTLRAGPAGS